MYMRMETDPPDTFEGPSICRLLWRGAVYLLLDLLDYPPLHGKETASSRMVVEKIFTLYMSRKPLATCGGSHACYHQNRLRPSGPVHIWFHLIVITVALTCSMVCLTAMTSSNFSRFSRLLVVELPGFCRALRPELFAQVLVARTRARGAWRLGALEGVNGSANTGGDGTSEKLEYCTRYSSLITCDVLLRKLSIRVSSLAVLLYRTFRRASHYDLRTHNPQLHQRALRKK